MDVLTWLQKGNDPLCQWDARTCEDGAKDNNLGVLRWLRQGNYTLCPLGAETSKIAIMHDIY